MNHPKIEEYAVTRPRASGARTKSSREAMKSAGRRTYRTKHSYSSPCFISFVYISIEEAIQFFKGVVAGMPTEAGRQHAKENLWVIEAYVKVTRAKNPLKPEEYQ